MLEKHPPFIEPLHRLGQIEWLRGRREKALKYLCAAFELGRAAMPYGLEGTLPEANGDNGPFYDAATDLLKALAHFRRDDEALDVMGALYRLDRTGTWDPEGLAVPLMLRAGRITSLEEPEDDLLRGCGFVEFIRALLCLRDGRERQAVRAVCRGVRANPLLLTSLLDRDDGRGDVPFREGPCGFEPEAELHAALTAPLWKREGGFPFLRRLHALPWFREALEQAGRAARDADRVPPPRTGNAALPIFRACFSETVTEMSVEEFPDSAMAG
jgi:hypothetical protein